MNVLKDNRLAYSKLFVMFMNMNFDRKNVRPPSDDPPPFGPGTSISHDVYPACFFLLSCQSDWKK